MDDQFDFEQPSPIVKTNIDKISIESSGAYEGSFTVKNIGGGELSGFVYSNSNVLNFTPENFAGNSNKIIYMLNMDFCKTGDNINTEIVISTNGGEVVLPVIVRVLANMIETREGDKLASLNDFAAYAAKYPLSAKNLFITKEFMFWLFATGCGHMDMYDKLIKNPNKEQAMDSFLIVYGLKRPCTVKFADKQTELVIDEYKPSGGSEPIVRYIAAVRNGRGYYEEKIIKNRKADWLVVNPEILRNDDFDIDGYARLELVFYPDKIKTNRETVTVSLPDSSMEVGIKRIPVLAVRPDKEDFMPDETGTIHIDNHSGQELMIEIDTGDCPISFEGKRYLISRNAGIPFKIKLPSLGAAQMNIRKQPYLPGTITFKTIFNGKLIIKKINLRVWGKNSW